MSCAKRKRQHPSPAKDLYVSTLFRLSRAYVERQAERWFILSAEHGLLDPNEVVAPYERTLRRMSSVERRKWADRVIGSLDGLVPIRGRVLILAGIPYRRLLEHFLSDRQCEVVVPLKGLGIGRQLKWLKDANRSKARASLE